MLFLETKLALLFFPASIKIPGLGNYTKIIYQKSNFSGKDLSVANKIWFPRFQQPRQPINAHCGTVSAFTCEAENNFKQKLLILHFAETAILQNLKSDEVLEMKIIQYFIRLGNAFDFMYIHVLS